MSRLELELHTEKTKLVSLWDGKEGFDFLGFHHRRKVSETSKGQKFSETHQFPSKKAMQKMRDNIREVFASRSTLLLDIHKMIDVLNPKVIGMRNYYGLKNAGNQLNKIDWYIIKKFTFNNLLYFTPGNQCNQLFNVLYSHSVIFSIFLNSLEK